MAQKLKIDDIHLTDWIKAGAAIVLVVTAINEFFIRDRDLELARLNNTREFLMRGSEPYILESLKLTIEHASQEQPDMSQSHTILIDITPINEYLISWSSCVATELCDFDTSADFLCERLRGYESLAVTVLRRLNMQYSFEDRNNQYSGMLQECGIEPSIGNILPEMISDPE